MRLLIGVALGAAVAALSTAAMAQSAGADQVSAMPSPPTQQGALPTSLGDRQANLQESYEQEIMMLKKKMERLTREDGGQLSAEHQVSLQKQLDDVNRRFRTASRF
jgi:hypothetical protein